jgi:hypothetical protein
MKTNQMHPVAVMALNGDAPGTTICVVVCLSPVECYANKNCNHIGRVIAGKFVSAKDTHVSEREAFMIVRASFALRNSLANIYETAPVLSNQLTLALLEK